MTTFSVEFFPAKSRRGLISYAKTFDVMHRLYKRLMTKIMPLHQVYSMSKTYPNLELVQSLGLTAVVSPAEQPANL